MKKIIKLEGIDCAVCASKIESLVKKINGVEQASLNFVTGKLVVEFDQAQEMRIFKEIVKKVNEIEPDVEIEF